MKKTKIIVSLLLCVLMLSLGCVSVIAKTVYPIGDWTFEKINNDTEFEVDAYSGSDSTLSVPYFINDLSVTSIGTNAFSGNSTMTSISMPGPVANIGAQAFLNCSKLQTVVLSSDVKAIGTLSFSGCKSLKSINLDQTRVVSIPKYCFTHCDSLAEVTLPSTVTSLSEYAFSNMDNLKKIIIPRSVTSIDDKAFYASDNVVIYCYRGSYAHTYASDMIMDYVLLDEEEPTVPMTEPQTEPIKESYILGDSDGDGRVTILDATIIQRLLALLSDDPDGRIAIRGDVDTCGISIMDATYIQRFLAEFTDPFNIGSICYYE